MYCNATSTKERKSDVSDSGNIIQELIIVMNDKVLSVNLIEKIHKPIVFVLMSFWVSYSIIRTSWMLTLSDHASDFSQCFTVFYNILFIIGLVKIFLYYERTKKNAIFALLLLVFVFVLKIIGISDYLQVLIPVIALYGISFDETVKMYVAASGITLITILFASLIGIIPNTITNSNHAIMSYRSTLGFSNSNHFMGFYLFFVLGFLYFARKAKYIYVIIFTVMISTIILFSMSGSFTPTLIIFIVCLCMVVNRFLTKFKNGFRFEKILQFCGYIMTALPIILLICEIAAMFLCGKYFSTNNTNSMILRFLNAYKTLEKVGVKMPVNIVTEDSIFLDIDYNIWIGLGKNVYPGTEYVDTIYLNMLIQDGLIVLVPYISLQVYTLFRLLKQKEYNLMLLCSASILYGLSEVFTVSFVASEVFLWVLFSQEVIDEELKGELTHE